MRPNSAEVLQGIQGSLMTYILPELQSDYARTEMMLIQVLLGIVASEQDAAAQRLVDGNAALRELARQAADALEADPAPDAGSPAPELRALAAETDATVVLSDLRAANDRLRDAIGRLGAMLYDRDAESHRELRAAIIEQLQRELEPCPHDILGPRADG